MNFFTCGNCYLTDTSSFTDGIEESINKWIWISLSTDASEPTVEETGMLKHFPDCWIAPIVRISLWENLYFEIVMSTFQKSWWCKNFFNIKHKHVLSSIFECILECLFILLSFSFTIWNKSSTITKEYQHSSLISSIKWCYISDRIRCQEHHCEFTWIKYFVSLWFKESLDTWTVMFVSLRFSILR
jgi:hypothetical protein